MSTFSETEIPAFCLLDRDRTKAFADAIAMIVRSDSVVLDAGSGSGILALLAARAGARRVYAVEIAPSLGEILRSNAKRNGYEDVIHVISSDVRDAALPEQVDVVIAEMIETWLLDELQVPCLTSLFERDLVAQGAKFLPASYRGLIRIGRMPWKFYGLNVQFPLHLWPNLLDDPRWHDLAFTPLTNTQPVFEVDFATPFEGNLKWKGEILPVSAGIANAVELSGIALTDAGVALPTTVAFNGAKVLPIPPIPLEAGVRRSVSVEIYPGQGLEGLKLQIE